MSGPAVDETVDALMSALDDHMPKIGWVVAVHDDDGRWCLYGDKTIHTSRRAALEEAKAARRAGHSGALHCSVIGSFGCSPTVTGLGDPAAVARGAER